jgi:hypothetical protein
MVGSRIDAVFDMMYHFRGQEDEGELGLDITSKGHLT